MRAPPIPPTHCLSPAAQRNPRLHTYRKAAAAALAVNRSSNRPADTAKTSPRAPANAHATQRDLSRKRRPRIACLPRPRTRRAAKRANVLHLKRRGLCSRKWGSRTNTNELFANRPVREQRCASESQNRTNTNERRVFANGHIYTGFNNTGQNSEY